MILGTGAGVLRVECKMAICIRVAVLLLLCLCASSWGACWSVNVQADGDPVGDSGRSCGSNYGKLCDECEMCAGSCSPKRIWTGSQYLNVTAGSLSPSTSSQCQGAGFSGSCSTPMCIYTLACDTQDESDSVACEQNHDFPFCPESPKDSVNVCQTEVTVTESGATYTQMGLFNCPDGYTSLTECRPMMLVPGTCTQNGYVEGEQPPDEPGQPQCFASFDGTCMMMDRNTGNTFSCDCADNSCNDAYNRLADGRCKNPYQSSASSSASGGSSGSEGSSGSANSSASGGSSGSEGSSGSGGQGGGDGDDFEYDYNYVLNAIRANTQNIASNVDYTNTLLNQSVVPAVNNVGSTVSSTIREENAKLIQKYNDMIGEVQYIGNTLNSSASVSSPSDTAYNINYDTLTIDTAPLPNIDSLVSMNQVWLDSFQNVIDSINDPDRHDTIGLTEIYDFSDTNEIRQKLSDFFFPGQVSNSCPVLDHTIHWPQPMGDQRWYINFGNLLGKFDICSFVRWVVRLFTTIAIIFGSFKAVMRAFGGGGDE